MGNKLQFGFLISFCFFSLAFSVDAVCQSELEKLLQKSDSLIDCRNFDQALVYLEQALEISEQDNDEAQRVIAISVILLSLAGALISVLILRAKNQRIEQMKLEILNYLMQLDQQQKNTGEEHSLGRLVDKYELTGREAEIMEHLASGFRNEDIAERMFISRNTVKFHIKNIFIKLDVQNRVQALQKI